MFIIYVISHSRPKPFTQWSGINNDTVIILNPMSQLCGDTVQNTNSTALTGVNTNPTAPTWSMSLAIR